MRDGPLARMTELNKALAHPARLRLLAMLRPGEMCVCQLTAILKLAVSTVSAHLTDLRRAGLVEERKDGRWVFYRLSSDESTQPVLRSMWQGLEKDPTLAADSLVARQLRAISPEQLIRVDLDLRRAGVRVPPRR